MIYQISLHCRVVEKLGGRWTGVSCKAEDTRSRRFVARDFLPQEVSKEPQALARFRRKTLATSAWNHWNMNRGRRGRAWA
jgi:hypothetical protein